MKTNDIIDKIRALNLATYPYYELRELLCNLVEGRHLGLTLHRGITITRGRIGNNYSKKSDLSYKPASLNDKCQRASLSKNTMLYGTIVNDPKQLEVSRAISIAECSTLLKSGINKKGIEQITYGNWCVNEDLNVVAIVHEEVFEGVSDNQLLLKLKCVHDKFICDEDCNKEDVNLIAKFIAEEFSKPKIDCDSDYFISAVFSDLVTNKFGYDGILYPSVRMGGRYGLNIALKPNIVDSKLILNSVAESTLYKNGKIILNLIDKISMFETWEYIKSSQLEENEILSKLQIRSLDELTEPE